MPLRILSKPTAMRRSRVAAFFADVTQQIHSLRASGVISSHRFFARALASSALRKSAGSLCTGAVLSLAMTGSELRRVDLCRPVECPSSGRRCLYSKGRAPMLSVRALTLRYVMREANISYNRSLLRSCRILSTFRFGPA